MKDLCQKWKAKTNFSRRYAGIATTTESGLVAHTLPHGAGSSAVNSISGRKLLPVGILVPVYRRKFGFPVCATEAPWSWSFLCDWRRQNASLRASNGAPGAPERNPTRQQAGWDLRNARGFPFLLPLPRWRCKQDISCKLLNQLLRVRSLLSSENGNLNRYLRWVVRLFDGYQKQSWYRSKN